MENIRITFLGTGGAIPTKKRNHPSILVSLKNESILLDCGEGTQRQFKQANLSASQISKILISHRHGDHTFGLPGLLRTLAMQNYRRTLQIFGPSGTSNLIKQISDLIRGHEKINLDVKEISGKFLNEKNYSIEASPMQHDTPCNAYSITLKDKIRLDKKKLKKLGLPNSPLIKKLQEGKSIKHNGKTISSKSVSYIEKGKKITYIADTTYNENAVKLAKNSDIVICESTFLEKDAERAKDYKHMTAKQAATIAKKSKSKKLVLFHISQRYEKDFSPILKEAKSVFKNTMLSHDLMSLEI